MRACVVNQIMQWEDDGRTERVLWLHPGGEGMFTIDIFEAKALPMFRNAASIEAHERSGTVHVLDKDPWFRAVDEVSLPQKPGRSFVPLSLTSRQSLMRNPGAHGRVPPSGVGAVGNWPAAATAESLAAAGQLSTAVVIADLR